MDDRLRLVQMLSPVFPIGGFAYSQGLEQVMATGQVTADGLEDWVCDVLEFGSPQMDAVIVAQARAGVDPDYLSDLVCALASCSGARDRIDGAGACLWGAGRGDYRQICPGSSLSGRGWPCDT